MFFFCLVLPILLYVYQTTCRSTSIISAWILLSKFPVQVCSVLIRVARSLITGACNIFCCCMCSSTLCRASWSNLFEVLNWFPRHFLRTFARVCFRWVWIMAWADYCTVTTSWKRRCNKGSFSFHILFYCTTMQYERYEKLFAFQYRKFHKWNLILYGL